MSQLSNAVIDIKPLTPELMDDFGAVLRGNYGAGCWCMFPRLTEPQTLRFRVKGASVPSPGGYVRTGRQEPAPGLLGFDHGEPVGWIAVAPRKELERVNRSRATPPVDDEPVWVIPCVTVRKGYRGQGLPLH